MDLSKLAANDQGVIELKHPVTGDILTDDSKDNNPFSVTMVGAHTSEYKTAARKVGFSTLKKNASLDTKTMSFDEFNSAANEGDQTDIELISTMITDFNIWTKGKAIPFSKDAIKKLLEDKSYSWMLNQIKREIELGKVFFAN